MYICFSNEKRYHNSTLTSIHIFLPHSYMGFSILYIYISMMMMVVQFKYLYWFDFICSKMMMEKCKMYKKNKNNMFILFE